MLDMENSEINKYDMPLELEHRNVLSIILNGIRPGSVVLEFGPASGRMTKYMKETLGCSVYIVEIDDVAYRNAIRYAEDGVLGDILSFEWLEKFSGIKFDYIIFADVLEHLKDPTLALTRASGLLKENGRVYFSIPNIAYAGVLCALLQNRFEYRRTGLLDNTHIHFFTKESILQLLESAALAPIGIDTVCYDIRDTEFNAEDGTLPGDIRRFVDSLDFAHVYQYVLCAVLKPFYEQNADILQLHEMPQQNAAQAPCSLYLDCGQGFNEAQKLTAAYSRSNQVEITFPISDFQNIAAFRCDIFCDSPYVIFDVKASCDGGVALEKVFTNTAFLTEDAAFYNDGFAMFQFKNTVAHARNLTFSATVEPIYTDENGRTLFKEVTREYTEALRYIDLLEQYKQLADQNLKSAQQMAKEQKAHLYERLDAEKALTTEWTDRYREAATRVHQLNLEIARLQKDSSELSGRDASQSEQISALTRQVAELMQQNAIRDAALADLNAQLIAFRQSEFWKITWPARVLVSRLRGLRQRHAGRGSRVIPAPRTPEAPPAMVVEVQPGSAVYTDLSSDEPPFEQPNVQVEVSDNESGLILTPKIDDVEKIEPYEALVSVIIPTFNAGDAFATLLYALKSQKGVMGIELVIVDSGSTDQTVDIARFFGAVVTEIPSESFTHSYARNLGAKKASGAFLLFMTQDAMPTDDTWLYRMMTPVAGEEVAAASCAELPRDDCDLSYRVSLWCHHRYLGIDQSDRICAMPNAPDSDSLRRNGQLCDIACLIKADIFERFPFAGFYAEDLDLGIRLIRGGYKIAMLSSVKVRHSHNRPCGYYLKRSYVDKAALVGILPDFPISNVDYTNMISAILNGYAQVCAFLTALAQSERKNEQIATFFAGLRGTSGTVSAATDVLPPLIFGQPFSDEPTDAFLKKIEALSKDITPTAATIFPSVFDFVINAIQPYVEQHCATITPALKLDLIAAVFKRYATSVGNELADYVTQHPTGDPLTALALTLNAGV